MIWQPTRQAACCYYICHMGLDDFGWAKSKENILMTIERRIQNLNIWFRDHWENDVLQMFLYG